MRLALYKEWMYWKYVIPLLIICSFLVYFVEYGILLPLTFFYDGGDYLSSDNRTPIEDDRARIKFTDVTR